MCIQTYDHNAAAAQQQLAAQTAQQQQNAETQREANIASGKQSIDNAFSGFDDNYFNNYKQANIDAAEPQIADQYNVASDQLNAALTDRGVNNSTIAGGYYKNLEKTRAGAEGDAANNAEDAANSLRNAVEQQKTNLYTLNSTGADPSTIATQALGSATALKPAQAFSSIGDLFSSVLSPLSKAATSYNYSPYTTGVAQANPLANGNGYKVIG